MCLYIKFQSQGNNTDMLQDKAIILDHDDRTIAMEKTVTINDKDYLTQNSFSLTKSLPFVKMHGLGNDFVIVNQLDLPTNYNIQELAKKTAHPHTGIGADQFIIYNKVSDYLIEMFIFNHDGSQAEACGNANRCLASLMNKKFGLEEINIKVNEREIACTVLSDDKISVNMGAFSFNKQWMLSEDKIWLIAKRYSLEFKEMICVDIGNPHFVIFGNLSDQDKYIIGKQLQNDDFFKGGVNVNFASIKDDKIYLKVWERGTGFTLACGSGACASFAAAKKLSFVKDDTSVVFELGSLKIKEVAGELLMTGSANFIAEGLFYL